MHGNNVELEQVYTHYPLEMVLVAKKNDETNRTSNESMVEALFLFASNINIKKGKTPKFTYLALDTLKPITRGAGIKMRIDQKYTTKLNQVAMTLTSQFFCPSFAKLSKHYREGGLCRQIQVQKAGVGRKGLEAPPGGPRVGSTPKVANPVPQTPIWIDDKEVTEDMNIDETENSPRVPGRKRARDLEGIEGVDLFSEELTLQIFNQGGRQNDRLTTVDSAGSATYQLYNEVNGKTSNSEPVYHACLNYRDLKNGDGPMFNFAAPTSIRKARCSYTQKSLIAEIDDRLQRKVRRRVLLDSLAENRRNRYYNRPP